MSEKTIADLSYADVSFVDTVISGKVFDYKKRELVGRTSERFINDARKELAPDFDLECLLPERKAGEEANSQSLVFLLKDSGRRVLFTGMLLQDCLQNFFADIRIS